MRQASPDKDAGAVTFVERPLCPTCAEAGTTLLQLPFTTPRVDYDFQVPSNGTWYVWVRGQGRDGGDGNLMWGINRNPIDSVVSDGDTSFRARNGLLYNAADRDHWRWVRMGSQYLNAGTSYELNLWAGGVGLGVDRIIITTDSRTPYDAANGTSGLSSQVLYNTSNIEIEHCC